MAIFKIKFRFFYILGIYDSLLDCDASGIEYLFSIDHTGIHV